MFEALQKRRLANFETKSLFFSGFPKKIEPTHKDAKTTPEVN